MSKYYYLIAGLPDLTLEDNKLNYTVQSFREELYPELSRSDRNLIDLFYLNFDNSNILALLKDPDSELVREGLYSKEELLGLIDTIKLNETKPVGFPSYLVNFLSAYLEGKYEQAPLLDNILTGLYLQYALKSKNKFINEWFTFNQTLNNLFIAFTARKHNFEYKDQLVGRDAVTEQIRESNARDFGLSSSIDYLNTITRLVDEDDLAVREKQLDQIRWNWLEEKSFFHYFSIERLFVFLQQIVMVERWLLLDKEEGNKYFRKIIDTLRGEVQLPVEFRKNK